MLIDVPVGTRNELAAREATREIVSMLGAMGIPRGAIDVSSYPSRDPTVSGSIRVAYPLIKAVAEPCGIWPDDLGASLNSELPENRPYWNLGCATQRNLAASVAYPEDLVQPRAENRPDAARRQNVVDKYRQGQDPSTIYRQQTDSKVSTVGQ
jgi:pilus assembly protein CpaD